MEVLHPDLNLNAPRPSGSPRLALCLPSFMFDAASPFCGAPSPIVSGRLCPASYIFVSHIASACLQLPLQPD